MKKVKLTFLSALLCVFALSSVVLAQQTVDINPRLPAPGEAPAGSPVDKHGYLSISGNKMKSSKHSGDVQLKGMSFFWGNAGGGHEYGGGFYTSAVVGWLVHDWRVDVLRAAVAIGGSAIEPNGGGTSGYLDTGREEQWAQLKMVVEESIRRGTYVIVDWHSHMANNHTDSSASFFRRVAREWGEYPNIIYEIFNEPTSQSWSTIVSYSNTVINAIRNQEAANQRSQHKNVIIVGTRGWSALGSTNNNDQDGNVQAINNSHNQLGSGANAGVNLAYSLHFYAASSAHNGYKARLTNLLALNKAVFVSEFGVSDHTGGGNTDRTNASDWLGTLDDNKVSWVNWSVTNKRYRTGTTRESSAAIEWDAPNATNGGWTVGPSQTNTGHLTESGWYIRNRLVTGAGSGVTNNGISNTAYTVNTTTATTTGEGTGGTVTRSGSGTYNYGDVVILKAEPANNYEFRSWSGDLTSGGDHVQFTIRGVSLNIEAVFFKGGLIKNGAFASGLTPWAHVSSIFANGEANPPSTHNAEFKSNIVNQSNQANHFLVRQTNIQLEEGKGYRLAFRAKADEPRRIAVVVASGGNNYFTPQEMTLNTSWADYYVDFTAPQAGAAQVEFWYGIGKANWSMTNVSLIDEYFEENGKGSGIDFVAEGAVDRWQTVESSISTPVRASAAKTAWSVVRTGGSLQLSGPAQSGSAKVYLYDVRGRLVKSVSLKDGQAFTLNKSVAPAGSYLLVVRNGSGKDVYKTRVSLVN